MPTAETIIEQLHEDIRRLNQQPIPIPNKHSQLFADFVIGRMEGVVVDRGYKHEPLTGTWPIEPDRRAGYIQKDWIDHDFRRGGLRITATIPFERGVAQISIREDDPHNDIVVKALLPSGEIDFKFV